MRKGNASIESLISVSTLLLLFVLLMQVLLGFAIDDIKSQSVYDTLIEINNYALAYDLIGYDDIMLDDFEGLDLSVLKDVGDISKQAFIESIFRRRFKKSEIDIVDDWLTGYVSIDHSYLMHESTSYIYFSKRLFTYGDDSDLYDHKNIKAILDEIKEDEKVVYVYKTKSGSKYHQKGCFYLTRSTTDQDAIEKISIYKAKYIYFLTPCKKCMEEP